MAHEMIGHQKPPGERVGEMLVVNVVRRVGSSKKFDIAAVHLMVDERHTILDPEEARELARLLCEAASEVERVSR